jgi:hypothetical protein
MVSPVSGILPVSGTLVLALHIDSAGLLAPGVYTTTLIARTDTPYYPFILTVTLILDARYYLYLPQVVYPLGPAAR